MIESELMREIKKWTEKLDETIPKTNGVNGKGEKLVENIKAYRKDSEHFLEKDDLVRSFESLIWAWALLETGRELGHLE